MTNKQLKMVLQSIQHIASMLCMLAANTQPSHSVFTSRRFVEKANGIDKLINEVNENILKETKNEKINTE